MINLREFVEDEHYKFCKKEYDDARNFLKNCGKPKDAHDLWLIQEAKFTATLFRKYA